MKPHACLVRDLKYVFSWFPTSCLLHLRANRHRLTRGTYQAPDGGGCIFYLLTETLPAEQRITSKAALTRYFGGDPARPEYQPARWLVRLWDRQICVGVRKRHGEAPELTEELLLSVLEEVIREREAGQEGAAMRIVCSIPIGLPPGRLARAGYPATGTA
jgi:hypothetical protein